MHDTGPWAADGGPRPALAAARARVGLVGVLCLLAAAGWWWTARQMRGMDAGPWTALGGFSWFVLVWLVMMAAMMFPSLAPTVALHARMTRSRSPWAPAAFTAGYLVTWTAAGVVAWLVAHLSAALLGTVGDGSHAVGSSPGPPWRSRASTNSLP